MENLEIRKNVAISENGFIFDAETANTFSVNGLGKEILEMLRQDANLEEIKYSIINRYEVDTNEAEKDLTDFIGMLRHFKLAEINE